MLNEKRAVGKGVWCKNSRRGGKNVRDGKIQGGKKKSSEKGEGVKRRRLTCAHGRYGTYGSPEKTKSFAIKKKWHKWLHT